ncbi:WXG100 family type VII secretion target [Streptomyces roseoverticillatus]|uniref:WXG100 family type VII secretion target n=1 Tax=Streptomyces roseoverticillatus TaxID=66429 RepID=UPI0004C25E42|nr:type VII secretion target [Streptomyces roseoverticillatus]
MDLKVEPGQLEAFARQVGRGAEDLREVLAYVRRHTLLRPAAGGLFEDVVLWHGPLRDDVLSALQRLAGVLQASSEELATAAAYYRRTDRRTAAAFDAAIREKDAER